MAAFASLCCFSLLIDARPLNGSPAKDMSAAPQTVAWTPRERESFFAATARHRKAARRFDLLCGACVSVLAFVVAVLTAPLLYGLLGLLLDIINLVVPTPDLQGAVSNAIFALVDAPGEVSWARWWLLAVLAALPGLVAMGLVLRSLSRVMREAMCMDAGGLAVRAPNLRTLEEQRFANVVAEMAIAAGLPAPRVLVSESASPNAAAFGLDEEHGSIIFTTGLLERLDRAQLQGVAAHLVATIANGDLRSGARVATTLGLFGRRCAAQFRVRRPTRCRLALAAASIGPAQTGKCRRWPPRPGAEQPVR
ncbi:MAG: M48 family metalloprotease [Gammaproteobacteria bacterium]|nr:M48 family metalloprotease [Gammaproteobacteria bacterium]